MSEELKGMELRMDTKFKQITEQLGDLKGDFKDHVKEHGQEHRCIDSTLNETGQRISVMETIIPDLKDATSGLTKAIDGLNQQMTAQSIYNKQNTDFRLKFTWKEILAFSLGFIALISAFGGKI